MPDASIALLAAFLLLVGVFLGIALSMLMPPLVSAEYKLKKMVAMADSDGRVVYVPSSEASHYLLKGHVLASDWMDIGGDSLSSV